MRQISVANDRIANIQPQSDHRLLIHDFHIDFFMQSIQQSHSDEQIETGARLPFKVQHIINLYDMPTRYHQDVARFHLSVLQLFFLHLRTMGIALQQDIADLIQRSFAVFHRQFMQIRCGINLAVFAIHTA